MSLYGISLFDALGFVTGLLCVWFLVRNSVWNWPWGIVNAALYLYTFWTAGLFGDAALQVLYVVLNAYGWWAWLRGGVAASPLPVSVLRAREWGFSLVSLVVLSLVFATVLARVLGSTVPLADGATTALSLVATFWQTRRCIENWWFWIAADAIYIPLYIYKHLPLTSLLYVVFLALCVAGVAQWRKELRTA